MVLLIYGIIIDLNTFNSEAPSIWPASMISVGMALIAADNTTAAKPVYIQIIIIMRRNVLTGRFINISPKNPEFCNLSAIGNVDKSLC